MSVRGIVLYDWGEEHGKLNRDFGEVGKTHNAGVLMCLPTVLDG